MLAGLRPRLIDDVNKVPGSRMLDGQFTAVQQAMGARLDCPAGAEFLASFVEETKASGFVEELIQKHGVEGRLTSHRLPLKFQTIGCRLSDMCAHR